jgi:hypothetical protein|tara:strand:+ start:6272 stop:6427 length:156 start_codon:yes stop_codon:yes gene_type:complete
MLYLKVENGMFGLETIFSTSNALEMVKHEKNAIELYGKDNVVVSTFKHSIR